MPALLITVLAGGIVRWFCHGRRPWRRSRTRSLILLLSLLAIARATPGAEGSAVKIEREGDGWRLRRNGEPFFIKGACGMTHLDALAAAGANSVRFWRVDERSLDQADRLGLSVLVGLPLGKPRTGFDYADGGKLAEQRERIRQLVLKLKDHPAVLMWAIGNEPTIFTPEPQRRLLWQEVNRLAELVKSLDPSHPVIAVVGGEQWRNQLGELDEFCPALDAVGLNAYADMLSLPEDLVRQGWKRPYLVTEFGPRGHWQVAKTGWGARLEGSSTEKAEFYRRAYEHAVKDRPQCLGAFAFLWGWKMEKTHTWYGMLLEDGSRTGAADLMRFLWSDRWPTNRCPTIASASIRLHSLAPGLSLPERADAQRAGKGDPPELEAPGSAAESPGAPGVFAVRAKLRCTVEATDPEEDPLAIDWDLRRDVADDPRVGGDSEPLEPAIPGAVRERQGNGAVLQLPDRPGRYRVFVQVRDGHGGTATANVPVLAK